MPPCCNALFLHRGNCIDGELRCVCRGPPHPSLRSPGCASGRTAPGRDGLPGPISEKKSPPPVPNPTRSKVQGLTDSTKIGQQPQCLNLRQRESTRDNAVLKADDNHLSEIGR